MSLLFVFPHKNHVTHYLAPFRYFFFCTKLCSLEVLMWMLSVAGYSSFIAHMDAQLLFYAIQSRVNRVLVRLRCPTLYPSCIIELFSEIYSLDNRCTFFCSAWLMAFVRISSQQRCHPKPASLPCPGEHTHTHSQTWLFLEGSLFILDEIFLKYVILLECMLLKVQNVCVQVRPACCLAFK